MSNGLDILRQVKGQKMCNDGKQISVAVSFPTFVREPSLSMSDGQEDLLERMRLAARQRDLPLEEREEEYFEMEEFL